MSEKIVRRSIQVSVLLIVAAGILLYLNRFTGTGSFAAWFSVLTTLTVIFVGVIIFLENRHPTSTVAWLLVLALFPIGGFLFYIMFGRNYRKRRMFEHKVLDDAEMYALSAGPSADTYDLSHFPQSQRKLLRLAQNVAPSPLSFHSWSNILTNGQATFRTIVEELEKAQHHIHMEYYIYRNDELGNYIKDILIEQAKRGVEVRFLYDAVGSLGLPAFFLQEMRDAGIEVVAFSPVRLPFLSSKVNYRNHRKIVVIDGEVGFIGGLNVGDEYVSKSETFGFWRDTHMMVKGEAVRTLQAIFLHDWSYMTGHMPAGSEYWFRPSKRYHTGGALQIIAGGPDHEWDTVKHLFFTMITSAKESVWIASPYFIPDEDIVTALKAASWSGVDVKILFPKKPDKWLPYLASHSYFPSLSEAGVEIYEYEKGFLHAKILLIDGTVATIGTANMDMRSFHLNFEVNAFLYGTESVETLVQDFREDLSDSTLIPRDYYREKGVGRRLLESAARLFSPLL